MIRTRDQRGLVARVEVPALALLLAALCVSTSQGGEQRSQAPGTEIQFVTGGTLIDGTGRAPRQNAAIVIENGRIATVGTLGELTPPTDAEALDASGKFIVPGLIDAHIHYRDWLGEVFLAHGVTSAFDLADPTDGILAVRDAISDGALGGPRLYVSGNLIDGQGTGLRASMGGGGGSPRSRQNRTLIAGPEEARQAVRDLAARGVDLIKVYQSLTPDRLAAVVQEARRAGLAVSAPRTTSLQRHGRGWTS